MSVLIREKYNDLMDGAYAAFVETRLLKQLHGQAAAMVSAQAMQNNQTHLRILDIGVGVGVHLTRILDELPSTITSVDVIAIDPAERALEVLARSLEPYAHLVKQTLSFTNTIEGLSASDIVQIGQIDVALALLSLHHIRGEGKKSALELIHRLNPGLFVLGEWNFNTEETEATGDSAFSSAVHLFFDRLYAVLRGDGENGRRAIREFLAIERQQIIEYPVDLRPKYMRYATEWQAMMKVFWQPIGVSLRYIEPERIFGLLAGSRHA